MLVLASTSLTAVTRLSRMRAPAASAVPGRAGRYAVSVEEAARALVAHSDLTASEIVRSSLKIASQIDVYTNDQIVIEEMEATA